jgi:hypothetical protein
LEYAEKLQPSKDKSYFRKCLLHIGLTENAFHSLKRGIELKEEWHKSNNDWNLGGPAQVVVTKIHFIKQVHFCVFRNVQKEKKMSRCFPPYFSDFSLHYRIIILEKQNDTVISYFNVIIKKACLTQARDAS